MGYNALYIVKNFGTLCWTAFVGPVVWLAYQLLARLIQVRVNSNWIRFTTLSKSRFEAAKLKWNKRMLFNYWIGLLNQTYIFLTACCCLNLYYYWKWDTFGDLVNSLISVIIGVVLVSFPIFVAIWYNIPKNYDQIIN
jgi:hypothetical protein